MSSRIAASIALSLTIAITFLPISAAASGIEVRSGKQKQLHGSHGSWKQIQRRDTDRGERAERRKHRGSQGRSGGVIGGDGLPSVLPGVGTYSGSILAARIPGVGNYFAADGFGGGDVVRAPTSRIIFVEDGPDCSWEAGVCVIRPRQ